MKQFLAALALSLCVCVASGAVQAFETPVQDEAARAQLEKLGAFFMPIAAKFGCAEFSSGNVLNEGRVATLEYLPAGAVAKDWTRRLTVTVHVLNTDPAAAKEEISKQVQSLGSDIESHSQLLGKALYKNSAGEDSAYYEYTIGSGPATEHKAGVFMRVSPALASFMQLQARGAQLTAEDRLKMKQLIDPRATR